MTAETCGTDNPGVVGGFGGKRGLAEGDAVGDFESGEAAPAVGIITGGLPTSLIDKLGGILISGVRGLGPLGFEVIGPPGTTKSGMLGFDGIAPLEVNGLGTFCEDGRGAGVVDPGTGGLISSDIS